MPGSDCDSRFERVTAAFEADGFRMESVDDPGDADHPARAGLPYLRRGDSIACAAVHKTAINTKTGKPKPAFYLEGSPYRLGWFMGAMAYESIGIMAEKYCDNVVPDFFDIEAFVRDDSRLATRIKDLILEIIYEHSQELIRDVPHEYVEELKGMLDGCLAAKPGSAVNWERLWALNYGIDALVAHIYTGRLFDAANIHPAKLKVPIGCNAFGMRGPATEGGASLLGRDFMFPTAKVFQDVACLVVCRPDPIEGRPRKAFVSMTAPGMIGSVAAMNEEGVGIGIEMLPSSYCDPNRPGFNALGLNRDAIQYSATTAEAVEHIARAQRGVSWIYAISDRSGDACMLETGRKPAPGEAFPYKKDVTERYRRLLPDEDFLREMRARYGYGAPDRGVFPRRSGFRYPMEFVLEKNPGLFSAYNAAFLDRLGDKLRGVGGCLVKLLGGKYGSLSAFFAELGATLTHKVKWEDCDSGERGFYCKERHDENIPGPFYFVPQRESRDDLILVTNSFIGPEMRPLCMNEWLAFIAGSSLADFQWRYDTLNSLILDRLEPADPSLPRAPIGFEDAWRLIDYLDPVRGYRRDYYNPDNEPDPGSIQVGGSVNLLDLSALRLRSLWGYYGDDAVEINLRRYL